ncbi:pseudouridine synthase [compost metagenome]
MHPSYQMDREYAVRVRGEVDEDMLERLKTGVMLEDGPARFTDIKEAPGGEGFNHWYHCVVMEGRNREVRRLWESQGVVVSRLKRVRFGPVFLTSELTMGRWREMGQAELDILSEEVGLKPVPLPAMKEKARDKLDRLQRKSAKPVGRATRQERVLRPAHGSAPRSSEGERPARAPRDGERPARKPRDGADRPARPPRGEAPERAPRPAGKRGGTPVAERPSDVNKKRSGGRPAAERADRPAKPVPAKRRPPAGEGQRPGFGRGRKPE